MGVSGHVNHRDTFRGVMEFYRRNESRLFKNDDLELWTLHSVSNVFVKYLPLWDVFKILYFWCTRLFQVRHFVSWVSNSSNDPRRCCCFMMLNPILVWRAMKAHHSQFVWYRKLFVIFSRYSYANDWTVHTPRNSKGIIKT
mmetsp:Transcript_8546/g.16092  ORF Transcript_8546/g.16092 Transcript_8546/m.16092 type:complete len:141 (-) Transcript_8546:1013-1435(-)